MTTLAGARISLQAAIGGIGLLLSVGHVAAQDSTLKTTKQHHSSAKASKAAEALPCPRAQWKDDPVCADAPDEKTLPMPHLNRPTIGQPETSSVKLGAKWQASNMQKQYPGGASAHALDPAGDDFQSRNTPPDTRVNMGVDMRF